MGRLAAATDEEEGAKAQRHSVTWGVRTFEVFVVMSSVAMSSEELV